MTDKGNSIKIRFMRSLTTILLLTFGTALAGCASSPTRVQGTIPGDDSPAAAARGPGGDARAADAQSPGPNPGPGQRPGGFPSARARGEQGIAPGFELGISSLDDQTLNGRYRVDFDGNVKLPYNVVLRADGAGVHEFQHELNNAYRRYFRASPNITVTILERKYWVEVRGLVEKPGRFLVRKDTSIDEIIGAAGGMLKTATPKYVKIDQHGSSVTVKLADYYGGADQGLIPPWYGGDVISLLGELATPEAESSREDAHLQLLGEVRSPGEYHFRRNADFYYYLAKAGGPTNTADLDKVEVIRGPAGNRQSTTFELKPRQVPPLEPGDVVIVHSDQATKTERAIATVTGVTGIINTLLLSIILLVK